MRNGWLAFVLLLAACGVPQVGESEQAFSAESGPGLAEPHLCTPNCGNDECGCCGEDGTILNCTAPPGMTATCSGTPKTCHDACNAHLYNCDSNLSNGCETSGSLVTSCGGCTGCDTAHSTGAACTSYKCTYTGCQGGYSNCNAGTGTDTNGCETNTGGSDVSNCGGCGSVCTRANATPQCSNGVCDYSTCSANFFDCDSSRANGCEISGTTTAHCGACAACDATHSTPAACDATGGYHCTYSACAAGYADCNSATKPNTDGCETPTSSDPLRCGGCAACGLTNASAATCASGVCQPTCNANWGVCGGNPLSGCLVNLQTDVNNCGTCGHVCPAPLSGSGTAACVAGACTESCSGGTPTLCGATRCISTTTCCTDSNCTTPNECHVNGTGGHGTCSGPGGSCSYTNAADGAKCNSPKDNLCNNHCQSGICVDFAVQPTCPLVDCHGASGCDSQTGNCVPGSAVADGTPCGATGCFTAAGGGMPTCAGGACNGTPKDCTSKDGPCTVGKCNATDGSCQATSKPNGTACTSTSACVLNAQCSLGQCTGTAKDCPTSGPCKQPSCDPATGNCTETNAPAGMSCTSEDACQQNQACDSNGTCSGTAVADGTPCDPEASCVGTGQCMSGACACVMPPEPADMAAPTTPGMGSTDMAASGSGKHGGCDILPHPTGTDPIALAAMALLILLLVRRRRAA